MLACAVCGEPNPERARFCLQCGAPIGREAAPPPETRKVVAVAERVAQLLGLEDTPGPVSDAAWAVRKLLEALARDRLLVLVLDDLHWAEPTLLDVVEQVAGWSRDAPILLLCVARSELLEQRPTWGGGKLNATSILLEPLEEAASSRLLDNLLGDAALDAGARARITELSGGNPLYLEELTAMLMDAGHLQRDHGVWHLPATEPISVPPTIQALLAARLDQLAGGDRGVLERASVVGQVFERAAVEELSPPEARPGVPARLLELTRRQLLRVAVSALAREAFQFRHILIRDAAYEAMPKRRRAELHERFAVWLQATLGQRAAEHAEIIGYHYEQAVRLWTELGPPGEHAVELGVLAADQLGVGGDRAVARGDMRAAVNLLSRADSLYPRDDPRGLALLPTLARALRDLGEFDRADEVIDRAERGAQASGDGPSARRCCSPGPGWATAEAWRAGTPTRRVRPRRPSPSTRSWGTSRAWRAPGACSPRSRGPAARSRPARRPSSGRSSMPAAPATTWRRPPTTGCWPGRPSTVRCPSRRASAGARRCCGASGTTRPCGLARCGRWRACGRCTGSWTRPACSSLPRLPVRQRRRSRPPGQTASWPATAATPRRFCP